MYYLTPDRFRAMGFGIDLTDFEESDVELRSTIARASALVNAYCAAPSIPVQHDFRGGSITGEQHRWRLADLDLTAAEGSRRVYPYHTPIRSVDAFKVFFTNTFSVAVDPSNLYVDSSEGWAEVVSIAAVVSGVYPVGINFGLYTPRAVIDYTYGWLFRASREILDDTDAATYRATNQFWKTSPAPVIYVNDVIQASGFTIDYSEGTVVFDDPLTATDVVTADYSYSLPPAIAEATGITVAHMLGERDLQRKGMAGVAVLRVAEVEIRRSEPQSVKSALDEIEPEVEILLAPYVFHTVR